MALPPACAVLPELLRLLGRAVRGRRGADAAEQDSLEWLVWVESGHLARFLVRSGCQAMTIPTPRQQLVYVQRNIARIRRDIRLQRHPLKLFFLPRPRRRVCALLSG